MSTVETLTAEKILHAQQQASAIAANAEHVTDSDQFVFFAAFDGTNNDKNDVALSGNPKDTNVAQLFAQADRAAKNDELPSVFRLPEAPGYAAVSFVR